MSTYDGCCKHFALLDTRCLECEAEELLEEKAEEFCKEHSYELKPILDMLTWAYRLGEERKS